MFERFKSLVSNFSENRRPEISVGIDGINLTTKAKHRTIPWNDIKRVAAFRRDIYLGLVVCLAIEIENGSTLHVIEGDPAWLDMMNALDKKLPGAIEREQWFLDVAAGKQDLVLIYDRAGAPLTVIGVTERASSLK